MSYIRVACHFNQHAQRVQPYVPISYLKIQIDISYEYDDDDDGDKTMSLRFIHPFIHAVEWLHMRWMSRSTKSKKPNRSEITHVYAQSRPLREKNSINKHRHCSRFLCATTWSFGSKQRRLICQRHRTIACASIGNGRKKNFSSGIDSLSLYICIYIYVI